MVRSEFQLLPPLPFIPSPRRRRWKCRPFGWRRGAEIDRFTWRLLPQEPSGLQEKTNVPIYGYNIAMGNGPIYSWITHAQWWCSIAMLDYQRVIMIKGSWEAILPSYEWLLLDGIDYDEGWCASETWHWWRVVWAFALHDNTEWWRVVREWDLTLMKGGVSLCITWQYRVMKGGARVRLDLDEGWCEPLHYMTIQQKRTDFDEGWCETLHYITIHQKRTDLDEGWCETWHYITIHQKRTDLDEGWCETLHYITIHEWRADFDEGWCETLHNNTWVKNWLWWRVVWDFTLHDNTWVKNWLWVLQRVVVPVCVVLCGSWISGCRL